MAVTNYTLRLVRSLEWQLQHTTDGHTRELVKAWATAWDEVAPDLEATLDEIVADYQAGDVIPRALFTRSQRLASVLDQIGAILGQLARQAGIMLSGDVADIVQQAGSAQAAIVASQLPPHLAHQVISPFAWDAIAADQAVTLIVHRTTQQITSRLRPIPAQTVDIVRRELIRGVAVGLNPRDVARGMVARAESRFNFGLSRAMTIARTEILDAHRAAAALAQAQHAEVLQGWMWLAKLDTFTCPSCWSQAAAGTVHPLDEPGPHDHPNGRCARMPVTKSWAELGFTLPAGITEPAPMLPNVERAFEQLHPTDQRKILGPGRYAAYREGRFPIEDWSVRRENPGWRPSYGVAPVPATPARQPVGG